MPLSIGDPTLVSGATAVVSQADLFGLYLQGGRLEVSLLAGAQLDRHGNLNTTVIGDYDRPKVRLPGSGGACEIAINTQRVLIMMSLGKRAFVERLDFLTSPGHLQGHGSRAALGIPGSGPEAVISDKGIFRFDDREGEMLLASLHPGYTVEDVQAGVGWPLAVAPDLERTEPPSVDELRILRQELDPDGIYRR